MPKTLLPKECKLLSGSALKTIAIICMFIDHAAYILYPVLAILRTSVTVLGRACTLYWIMRKIGRLAFPIFCFLIAEGYQNTRSKGRYALRLLIFAIVSEIPFNLMSSRNMLHQGDQNVFFTLFLGLLLIHLFASLSSEFWKYLTMSAVCVLAYFLKADYGLNGALLVFMFYLFRNMPAVQPLLAYPLLSGEICAVAACIPINLYNGKRGYIKTPLLKIAFYAFYPLHILLIVLIRKTL